MVADASVIVKWYVVEEHREEALLLREDYVDGRVRIASPELMPFEVLNAVRYSRRDLSPKILREVARSLHLYGFDLWPLSGEYADLVVELSLSRGITIYDASYAALALHLDSPLYTADERLLRALGEDFRGRALHISQYRGAG
ncbi:MAG: PIN domain nuclease, partial [Thermoproteota archaeon]